MDTSALIHMKMYYPRDVFASLWENMENLTTVGRLVCPQQVFEELEKKDDELLEWAKIHKSTFREVDAEQIRIVRGILARFPELVDAQKTTEEADPFVIALAIYGGEQRTLWEQKHVVVSEEKPSGPGGRPKIPDVCKSYDVEHLLLIELFREENWKF